MGLPLSGRTVIYQDANRTLEQRHCGDELMVAYVAARAKADTGCNFLKMPPNIRMHLNGYSRLRPPPPAGDAER